MASYSYSVIQNFIIVNDGALPSYTTYRASLICVGVLALKTKYLIRSIPLSNFLHFHKNTRINSIKQLSNNIFKMDVIWWVIHNACTNILPNFCGQALPYSYNTGPFNANPYTMGFGVSFELLT